jgi:hypothetical protein
VHPYSTDSARQRTVLLLLAVLAILLAWALGRAFVLLHTSPPWWLDTPAVVGFYGLLWQAYDHLLWRVGPSGHTLSGVPYYAGTWSGQICSEYRPETPYQARLTIRQTSSRILIELETGQSRSHSRLAMVYADPGPDQGLQYVYNNRPREIVAPGVEAHGGSAYLRLSADGRRLDGGYSTGPERRTKGEMTFERMLEPT